MKIFGDLRKREACDIPNVQGYQLTLTYRDGYKWPTSVIKDFDGLHRVASHLFPRTIGDVDYWQEGRI